MASGHSDELLVTAREVTVGTAWLFGGSVSATIISAICSIIIARLLGPELYGMYSLALVVPSFLLLFTDFGISPAITRYTAKLRADGSEGLIAPLLRAGFAFNLLTAFSVLFLGLILSDFLAATLINRPELAFLARASVFLVLFQALISTANSTLMGFNNMRDLAFIDIIHLTVRTLISPLLIIVGFSVLGAIIGHVLAYGLAALAAALIAYHKHYRGVRSGHQSDLGGSTMKNLKTMVGYGLPLYLSSTLNSILGVIQGIILAYFATDFMIGNFKVAMNFTILIALLSGPIATTLFPAFSKLSSKSDEIKKMFSYSVKYTAALIVPATVFVIIASKELIALIYGPSYTLAPTFLALYAISFLYAGFGSAVLGSFFNGIGETKVSLKATAINSMFFIPSALLLTKAYSMTGLISSILISALASLAYSLWVAANKFDMKISLQDSFRVYASSAISAIPTALLISSLQLPIILTLAISATVYASLYLTLMPTIGGIKSVDIENFRAVFKAGPLKPIIDLALKYEAKLIRS